MTTFNTGNPIGSTAVKDLYDNAGNLDKAVNDQTGDTWFDRFGRPRKTWLGIEKQAKIDIAAAVEGATSDAINARNDSINARDDAIAAASSIGPLKFYDTYGQAMGDAANWPTEGLIEIAHDETRDGARTRYKPDGEALNFVVNLDQLRIEISESAGSSLVGHGSGTVCDALDANANALAEVREEVAITASSLRASMRATKFRAAIELGQRDAYVLLQGDSTGDEDYEFFRISVDKLISNYPSHTLIYSKWDAAGGVWINTVLHTGNSGRKIFAYNGSVSGTDQIYWHGSNKNKAYDGVNFDLIILNYGLNTDATQQLNSVCACLFNIRNDQPDAEIILIIQPPDYTDSSMLSRSQSRSDAQREASHAYGIYVSDAFSLFTELVKNHGGVGAWYSDQIHPNSAGQEKWADLLFPGMLNTSAKQVSLGVSNTILPNGNFTRWPNGTDAAPLWWSTTSSAARDTAYFETNGQALRGYGVQGSAGAVVLEATSIISKLSHLPKIVIAARVRTFGNSYNIGVISLIHSANSQYTEILGNDNGSNGVGSGEFRWAFLVVPRIFYFDKTDFKIAISCGGDGEFVTVDRIVISSDLVPNDSSGTEGFERNTVYRDTQFSIPPSSLVIRSVNVEFAKNGAFVQIYSGALPSSVTVTATTSNAGCEIRFANLGASIVQVPEQDYTLRIF